MCELLGMCFNKPVNSKFIFKNFSRKSENNPDGWGIAYYDFNNNAIVIKEPIKANESQKVKQLENENIQSKIFIAHVRRSSVGNNIYENTHPFYRKNGKKSFIFAHNGTLYNYKNLKLGDYEPFGDTDSEHAFCYLLNIIDKHNLSNWNYKENIEKLYSEFKNINNFGTFNCLFSDGEYLFCYHDKNQYNGFYLLQRKPPYKKIKYLDLDWEIDLSLEKEDEYGFIVATKELTNEDWKKLDGGELIVFKDGEIVVNIKN